MEVVNVTYGGMTLSPKYKRSKEQVLKTFETYFEKNENNCWEWNGSLYWDGYGVYTAYIDDCKYIRAHRVSYALYIGKIPKGLNVLHRCNNKKCVNPDHLYAGTHADNMKDLREAGTLKGKNNPNFGVICTEEKKIKISKGVIKQLKERREDGTSDRPN